MRVIPAGLGTMPRRHLEKMEFRLDDEHYGHLTYSNLKDM